MREINTTEYSGSVDELDLKETNKLYSNEEDVENSGVFSMEDAKEAAKIYTKTWNQIQKQPSGINTFKKCNEKLLHMEKSSHARNLQILLQEASGGNIMNNIINELLGGKSEDVAKSSKGSWNRVRLKSAEVNLLNRYSELKLIKTDAIEDVKMYMKAWDQIQLQSSGDSIVNRMSETLSKMEKHNLARTLQQCLITNEKVLKCH